MNKETFLYLLSNQQKWSEEFKEQKRLITKENNKKMASANHYSQTPEYKKRYKREGALFNK